MRQNERRTMKTKGFTLIELMIAVAILGIVAALGFAFFFGGDSGGPSQAEKTLQMQGFKNIRIGDNVWMGCGQDDSSLMSHHFTATNVNNMQVKGMVCCAMLKGCTVRF